MNFGTFLGFIIAIVVFIGAVVMSFSNVGVVIDLHAGLIVIGGTVAVALICFPIGRITGLLRVFLRRLFGKSKRDYMALIAEIVTLSEARRKSKKTFEAAIPAVKDLFLKDAANVLYWIQAEVSAEELRDLLETRIATNFKLYMNEAKVFKTMAKFPPAFGLMGTTIGMIALLQSLGNADAKNMIGPAMAIALVATLYGLVLTNFVFIPIAENLAEQTQEDLIARSIVVEGIMLIEADKPTKYIEEKVKSFLLPKQRGEDYSSKPGGSSGMKQAG
jgi:chemotaxis protein MotA